MGGMVENGREVCGRESGRWKEISRSAEPHLCLRAAQFVQTNQENDPGDTFSVPLTPLAYKPQFLSLHALVERALVDGVEGIGVRNGVLQSGRRRRREASPWAAQTSGLVTLICTASPV